MRSRTFDLCGQACILSICFALAAQTNPRQSGNLLDDGIKLLGEGRFPEAITALNAFKQTAVSDARPYFYSGIALTETGKLSAAALELSEAVRMDPQRPEYRIFQANVLSRLRQRAQAIQALAPFEKREAASRLDTAWLWLLHDVYVRLERDKDAMSILELVSARTPADPRIELRRGKIHAAKGELDLAVESFKKVVGKPAADPSAYFELGKVLHQRNETGAAKRAFIEAVKRDPQNPEYLLKLGLSCLALGQHEEALDYLKRAEPSGSTHPQIYYALGNAYQIGGDRAKAIEYRRKYQQVSLAERNREEIEREVGKLIKEGENHLDQGKPAEARAVFEKTVRLDPENWDARGYLAEMFLSAGDPDAAYEHLLKMAELEPESVVGNYLMARHWFQRKDFEKARLYAEKVRLVRPGHADLRLLLGHIYLGLGRQDDALRQYEVAVQLAPDRPDFRENLRQFKNRHPQKL